MSFRFSFAAAALISARTRLRVALFVRRLVTLVNPWVFANACMSFASNSHAVSCPSQPLYSFGSTALRPMWRDAPIVISVLSFWNTPILTRTHRLCKTIVAPASRTGLSARQFRLHKLKSRVYLESRVQLDYARQRERGKQRAGRD